MTHAMTTMMGMGLSIPTTAVPSVNSVSRMKQCNGLDDDYDAIADELAEQPCFDGDDALIGVESVVRARGV